jgi:hypothetical protein
LQAARAEAGRNHVVPAVIDSAAAQTLGLSVGQQFALSDSNNTLNYTVVTIVQSLPTIYDTSSSSVAGDAMLSNGGLLVDMHTMDDIAQAVNSSGISPTQVWLRSSDDASSLASVRFALNQSVDKLDNVSDRRLLLQSITSDPLYSALTGILAIGAGIALLLRWAVRRARSWQSSSGNRPWFMEQPLYWVSASVF